MVGLVWSNAGWWSWRGGEDEPNRTNLTQTYAGYVPDVQTSRRCQTLLDAQGRRKMCVRTTSRHV
eukprot:5165624-Prymnesium_polylepis.1